MTMEMPEAIKAYSIAVALLSPAKRRSDVDIARVADLNMALPPPGVLIRAS
jgi:hypothetical protein